MKNVLIALLFTTATACWPVDPPAVDPEPVKMGKHANADEPVGSRSGSAKSPLKRDHQIECPPNPVSRRPAASSGEALPETLSRDDVFCGTKKIEANVSACSDANSRGNTITVQFTIGPDGGVIRAETVGQWAGTQIGDCAAKAVRGAVFPVSKAPLTVMIPFKL